MWLCEDCGWVGEEPIVIPRLFDGEVIDIDSIMCPVCDCDEDGGLEFDGVEEDRKEFLAEWIITNR